MKKLLTIAGSDSSGGAGIQADLKTFAAHKLYGMSVITALTAQNTTGVAGIFETTQEFVEMQLNSVLTDIFPDAIKIGMVSNSDIIEIIVKKLKEYKATNIVVDPVMVATSGSKLLNEKAMDAVINKLIPIATVITPNIPEAEALANITINSTDDMIKAAEIISDMLEGAVLIKGGHLTDTADDLLYLNDNAIWIKGERINNPNTHGTGCTLSSAIACGLANGKGIEASIRDAKSYITGSLKAQLNLGKGSGPLNHCWNL